MYHVSEGGPNTVCIIIPVFCMTSAYNSNQTMEKIKNLHNLNNTLLSQIFTPTITQIFSTCFPHFTRKMAYIISTSVQVHL